jgi:hypothetical protein
MSMKWVGFPNHNLQHIASENPSECPTATTVCETMHLSVWGCTLMTTSRNRRCETHVYMYEEI